LVDKVGNGRGCSVLACFSAMCRDNEPDRRARRVMLDDAEVADAVARRVRSSRSTGKKCPVLLTFDGHVWEHKGKVVGGRRPGSSVSAVDRVEPCDYQFFDVLTTSIWIDHAWSIRCKSLAVNSECLYLADCTYRRLR
jgi:hypothetical protein